MTTAVSRAAISRARYGPGPTGRATGVVLTGPTGVQSAPLEYLYRPYAAALNPTAAMAVLMRATISNGVSGQILAANLFAQSHFVQDGRWGACLGFADATRVTVFVNTTATATVNGSTPVGSVPLASGRHAWYGGWYLGSGGTDITRCNFDIDGVLNLIPSWSAGVPTTLRAGNTVYTPGVPTCFGQWPNVGGKSFPGTMSDIMIFNYKPSDAERAAIYAAADPVAVALAMAVPPVSYWKCDEETGFTAFDIIGSRHLHLVTDPTGTSAIATKGRRFEGNRYAYRQEQGTRKFYSFPSASPAGGTKIMCAWDSRTVASGENEPGQAANVYSYRVGLYAWLRFFGRSIDMVGPNTSAPTYFADGLHDGVSGRQAQTYAGLVGGLVTTHDPDILIGFGIINDQLTGGRTPAQCLTSIGDIITAALAAKPGLIIIIVDEPPSTNAAQQVNVDAYNAGLQAVINGFANPNVRRSYAGTRIDSRGNFDTNHPVLQGGDQIGYIVARDVEADCLAA